MGTIEQQAMRDEYRRRNDDAYTKMLCNQREYSTRVPLVVEVLWGSHVNRAANGTLW